MGTDDSHAIAEMVADDADRPEQAMLKASDSPTLVKLLEKLEPRERKILELRFGLDGYQGPPRTYKEIGAIIGLTSERVRQLENKALTQLRDLGEGLI